MVNIRHMLGQIVGLAVMCLALIVLIKLRQGYTLGELIDDPKLLFVDMFSGPEQAASGSGRS